MRKEHIRLIQTTQPITLDCVNPSKRPQRLAEVRCAVLGRAQIVVSYDNDLLADSSLRHGRLEVEVEVEIVDSQALMKIQEAKINSEGE